MNIGVYREKSGGQRKGGAQAKIKNKREKAERVGSRVVTHSSGVTYSVCPSVRQDSFTGCVKIRVPSPRVKLPRLEKKGCLGLWGNL